ncbi:MAG: helix-turn-helix transcriptional regulator [Helicobacteraceae bacterium]|jgi:MerR family transcriptional regulator/heat shock protein HspR|nr:helix-turn-helix transcriptional regulator [Helicobacteraceae bacterium]
MHSYEEPVYMISVVARALEVHPQTLRQYEREGLILPGRSGGKVRLYSQRDIDEIRFVLSLTRDMGVNLAGVDIALKLKRRIAQMQKEIDNLKARLANVNENGLTPPDKQIVPAPQRRITIVDLD